MMRLVKINLNISMIIPPREANLKSFRQALWTDGFTDYNAWNNGNRHPGWGVAEIQKKSPPTTVGDAADMQLCVIKQGSPPVLENVAFFVTDCRCAVCILNISVGME